MHCSALVCVVLALLLNCPNMDLLKELMSMGEALGYEGDTLRAFVKDQQAQQRDERNAQRQKEKEELENKVKLETAQLEKRKQNLKIR